MQRMITDADGHEHTLPGPYKTMLDIRLANEARGHYFFAPDTLRFFQSRISPTVYEGRLFITSEKPFYGGREYTVRLVTDDGVITEPEGEYFGKHATHKDARLHIKWLLMESVLAPN